MDFDILLSDFNNADETINFGTRNFGSLTNLYETSTLACLRNREKNEIPLSFVDNNVSILSTIKHGRVYLCINRSFRAFENKECIGLGFEAVFEDLINAFALSDDGKFLLICLQNGKVHLINFGSEETKCIFSKHLVEPNVWINDSYINCFSEPDIANNIIESNGWTNETLINGSYKDSISKNYDFVIVTKSGKVFKLFLRPDDNVPVEYKEIYDFRMTIKLASYSYPDLLVCSSHMIVLNTVEKHAIEAKGLDIVSIYPFRHFFLVLDSNGDLSEICPNTFTQFPVTLDVKLKHMTVALDDKDNFNIIGVTFPNDEGHTYVKSLVYPDMSEVFSIKLTTEINLIIPETLLDEVLYVSKLRSDDKINELRICQITETEPEKRLERLIRKHKFEEAEQFVTLFGLDRHLIAKAKAQLIVDKNVCETEDMANLIEMLDTINDDLFKLKICNSMAWNSVCPDKMDIGKILKYGCALVPKNNEKLKEILEIQQSLADMLFKFDTFRLIFIEENDVDDWQTFQDSNLITLFKGYVKNCMIEEAIIIYSRLDEDSWSLITIEFVEEVLSSINNLVINCQLSFLSTFAPVTLTHRPECLDVFVKWLQNKIMYMERRKNNDFPTPAIDFAEKFIDMLNVDKQNSLNMDSLADFKYIMKALYGLRTLKDEYSIKIPLSDYVLGPKSTIRQLLSLNMSKENYETFIKDFVYKFIVQNNLNPDEVFLQEISNLIRYREEYWTKSVETILKYISSKDLKVQAVKIILNAANVPWTDSIRKIAQKAVEYSPDIEKCIKNEPRKVIFGIPAYKFKETQVKFDNLHFAMVIKRIIYVGLPSMLDDINKVITTPEEKQEANKILVMHFIRHGKYLEALSLLKDCTTEEIIACTEQAKFMDNFYEIAGSLYAKIIELCSEDRKFWYQEELKLIRNCYQLNKTFDCKYKTEQMASLRNRYKIRDEIIEELIFNFSNKTADIIKLNNDCVKLASYLSLNKESVILDVCRKLQNFDVIYQSAKYLYENDASPKDLCLATVLIFKYMGTFQVQLAESFNETLADNLINTDTNVFMEALKLAKKMSLKALMQADREEVMAVVNWVNSCFYLTLQPSTDLHHAIFSDSYVEKHAIPGYAAFTSIRNIFESYIRYIGTFKNPILKYLTNFNQDIPTTKDSFIVEINKFSGTIQYLCREGHYLTARQLLATLQNAIIYGNSAQHGDVNKVIKSVLRTQCLPLLLQAVMSAHNIDCALLYDILGEMDKNESIVSIEKYAKMYKRHPRKLRDISEVIIRYFKSRGILLSTDIFKAAVVSVKWWNKLQNCPISYDCFLKMDPEKLLKTLLEKNCVNENAIEEYCKDTSVDLQKAFQFYLETVLLNWKPNYEIETDVCGKRSLIIKNDENDLFKKCDKVIKSITNKNCILELLKKIWNKVNCYNYEVLLCILNITSILQEKRERNSNWLMLIFLKGYRRFSPPSQLEIEQWYTAFPDVQALDPFSEFRLPFSPSLFSSNIFNIIRSELNLKTYKSWFGAIDLVKTLNRDDICSVAIKEIVHSGVFSQDAYTEWMIVRHQDMWSEIDECLKHISNLEKRSSAIYHLFVNTPKGVDQVEAAKLCYKYAEEYKNGDPKSETVQNAFLKVQNKYFCLTATHILHMYQLNDPKYLQLVSQPEDLITALYYDDRILQRDKALNVFCPDINKAVDELGNFFNLKICKIRSPLLINWLNGNEDNVEFDSTIFINTDKPMDFHADMDDSLKRAAYICSSIDSQVLRGILIRAIDEPSANEKQNLYYKARSLKCLCAISSPETIVELMGATHNELMYFIEKLILLSRLEIFGFNLNVESLNHYNKKELLKRLIHDNTTPLAVSVMADICIMYSIEEIKYWKFIIGTSIKLNMFAELKKYLEYLKNKKCQYQLFYISAWQAIIEHSFSINNSLPKSGVDGVLTKNFLLIQSCPVLYSINFENTIKSCLKMQKYDYAALLLPYIEGEKQKTYAEQIQKASEDILEDLNRLNLQGLCVSNVKQILGIF
ncbi:unnamed protein product [Brassicogethes aeneus]|uniref:RZZ complex subunit KNTC1/ROD C-terminal domain-containing protein n=1 Tax=Brassicogethes aeneus TaxID=1431903 RepID=A0A9P0AZ91_BRAAE|nr:unnamed protein product [Brassicogethes aeneus]